MSLRLNCPYVNSLKRSFEEDSSDAHLPPPCGTSGIEPANFARGNPIYAFGSVTAKFPSLSIEKEFFQALPTTSPSPGTSSPFDISDQVGLHQLNETAGLNNWLHQTLSQPENIYIAREMIWILRSVRSRELYRIQPQTDEHVSALVAALQPEQTSSQSNECNCQMFAFVGDEIPLHADSYHNQFPFPGTLLTTLFKPPVESSATVVPGGDPQQVMAMTAPLLSLTNNDGRTSSDRALNYALLNDLKIYQQTYQLCYGNQGTTLELNSVRTETELGSGIYERVNVVFEYQSSTSGSISRWASLVDVTGLFPYIVADFSPYLGRA